MYMYLINRKRNTQIFLAGYIALLFRLLAEMSSIINLSSEIYNGMTLIFVIAVMYIMINQPMEVGFMIKLTMMILIMIFSYMKMRYFYVFISFFCIVLYADVDYLKVLRWSYQIKAFWLAVHIFSYIVTYICTPEKIDYVYRNGVPRHYFFLSHANTFSMLLVWTILEFLYVNKERLHMLHLVALWLCNVILNMFCDSKTSMVTCTIIIFLLILYKSPIEVPFKWVRFAAKYGFGIFSVLFCTIIIFYRSYNGTLKVLFEKLDQFFTGRLLFGAFAYDTNGWTLFGKTIHFNGTVYWDGHWIDSLVMDNAYYYCFLYLGTVYLIIISIGFFLAEKYMDDEECIFVLAYILYAATENYVVNSIYCFPLLFIGYAIYHGKGEKMISRSIKKEIANE